MRIVQNIQGQDIAVIKQILQHNNLTKASSSASESLAMDTTPTKTNTSASLATRYLPTAQTPTTAPVVTNNTYVIAQPTNTPQKQNIAPTSAPAPTPKPEPTPPSQTTPCLCADAVHLGQI